MQAGNPTFETYISRLEIIRKYFPALPAPASEKIGRLESLYRHWNAGINVISRKDMDNFYERHVLHSLSIARFIDLQPGSVVVDLGTGGGFPGIPLAIYFPEVEFHLTDSIGKKILVADSIARELGLDNVVTRTVRTESYPVNCDFAVTRAVAPMGDLIRWTRGKFNRSNINSIPNGIIALKGGDLEDEIAPFRKNTRVVELSEYFEEEFFSTKKLVYYHP